MRISRLQRTMVLAVLCCGFVAAFAFALDYPPLTGRVVDQAGVMTAETRSDVEAKSKALEDKSGIQLVVATVKSLQGGDIETYANALFRHWKLGQAQKNNGVLLLVAPAEHKVRIEVGYGLEGTLTDALTSVIISSAIIPRFKTGDFSGGIGRGVDGIVSVLSGDTADWQPVASVRSDDVSLGTEIFIVLFLLVVVSIIVIGIVQNARSGRTVRRGGRTVLVPAGGSSASSSDWGSSSSSDSGSSGDFSGGGGSSGGGGASGSW